MDKVYLDWPTILTLVIIGVALTALRAVSTRWPNFFFEDRKDTDKGTEIERIRELESRQEFLVGELQKAGAKIITLEQRLTQLSRKTGISTTQVTPVLVVIGADAPLLLDLASMRAVKTETGMDFRRVVNGTLKDLTQNLNRARINGHPYDKLHLAVHANSGGILLGGELITGVAFSEIVQGVKILLIAGCESSYVGDFLGVVPHVVTMTEKVSNVDAALFCRAFWTQIGHQVHPTAALQLALQAAPPGMEEYVEAHW